MTEFTPEHHDWVEPHEITALRKDNEARLSTVDIVKYYGDLAVFRATFFEKMYRHNAIGDTDGWAIFDLSDVDDDPFTTGCNVALHASVSPQDGEDGIVNPRIRIIANEVIYSENGSQILTTDIGINEKNVCSYLVDAIDPENQEVNDCYAPVFSVGDDGRLGATANLRKYVPVVDIYGNETANNIAPFGNYRNLADRRDALKRASDVLENLIDLEPVVSRPQS